MSLRTKVLSGVFWTGSARVLSQITNWAISIVVIRLLTPADYGLLAMATVFLSFVVMFAEAGMGVALIQAKDLNEAVLRSAFGAIIAISVALVALMYLAAPFIAAFYDEARVTAVVRVTSLNMLLSMFCIIPGAVLARDLDFKRQAVVSVGSNLFGGLCTLGMAFSGYGVWALVAGQLTMHACLAIGLNAISPFLKWPDFSLRGARATLAFGGKVTASRVLWFFSSQADILIGGKMLGKELLGIYSVSMHVASLPVQRIASLINSVAVAAFASIQDDRKRVAEYLLKSIRLVSLVSFPVLWGIASVSDEAVSVLLGPAWSDAVVPLRLLALLMPLRMLGAILPSATDGMGRPDISLRNLTLASVVMPPAFFVGCHWGIVGLAASWVLIYPLIVLQNLHRTAQAVGIRITRFFAAVWKPLAAGAFMVGTVTAARLALPLDLPDPVRLGLLVASGIAAYGSASLVMNREGLLELRDLLRRF